MYGRFVKRTLDAVFALGGLVALAIPMGLIAFCIKLTSSGPALFRQERIGQGGKIFVVRKFRTMTVNHGEISTVTVRGDSRITGFGRFMRRFKLDEFPQLWNVLMGEMSLVGPRPDVPGYYDQLQGEGRRVLDIKPGITGPSTIKYYNEEALLAQHGDPERFNDRVIFPDKVRINLEYMDRCDLWGDIGWIVKTLKLTFKTPSDPGRAILE
jgi:lipopolysaccharide/colanic/teichoic acid biosynthesis glycosyltransferase